MGQVILKKGRDEPVRRHHPRVFSGAIDTRRSSIDDVQPGDVIDVRDVGGGFLAQGYYNPHSQIRVRLLTWDQNDPVGPAWWRVRIARSIARRDWLATDPDTTCYRLINAENDELPGLVVDRYGDYLVVQALTLGVDVVKQTVVQALVDLLQPAGIYERSDAGVRELEGLADVSGLLYGKALPDLVECRENGMALLVDPYQGHKTGFYLDQRDSRRWILTHPLVQGKRVLNAFSYSGSFGVAAALNGAESVTNVDSSEAALDLVTALMNANKLHDFPVENVPGDVFEVLRYYREMEQTFDAIILDPHKFAHSRGQIAAATRGYKDINLLALELLEPGGLLLPFSCSSHVDADLFQNVVCGASEDAAVHAQIIGWFAQPADHPVLLTFPEGRYLKGLACLVT
ncbi:MAG: class I SAM-dependent rRNA methyltransferase [Anaerolineae bacterium]